MQHKSTITRLLLALTLVFLLVFAAVPALAVAYNYDVTAGGVLTVNVGDTIYMTNSHSTSGMVMSAYGRSSSNSSIVAIESGYSSRNATMKAVAPGTVTIKGELTGAFQIENYGTKYNSATGKYEQYKYYTTQSYTYPYGCNITVTDTFAPQITSQPKNTHGAIDGTVTFSVAAIDHSALTYQWYYIYPWSTSPLAGGTGATWSFTMKEKLDGITVYCVATDSSGNSTQSNKAVARLLGISKQPTNGFAYPGGTISTTFTAYGTGLKYQWYYKDPGMSAFQATSVTTPSATTVMNAAKHGRQLYCKVTDKYGNVVTSNTVRLATLAITQQPKSGSGSAVTVSVKAVGDGLKYQWFYKDPGMSAFQGTSVTTASATTVMNAAKHGRQLYCVVTDQYGKSVRSNTVLLHYLAITQQPQAAPGKYITASVQAIGHGLTYRWYYKDPGMSSFKDSYLTTSSVTTVMDSSKIGRQLFCKVTDQYGNSINSATVTLKTLVITQQPQNAVGGIASTTVRTTSDGLAYQWYYKDTSMSSFVKSDVKSATYSVSMNEDTHLRQVYCVITDQYGSTVTSDTATLYYLTITAQPKDVVSGRGALVTVSCEAAGEGLTYNWYRGLLTGSSEGSLYKGNASRFQRRLIDGDERDFYYCIVTDKYGNSVRSENIRIYFFSIYYPSPTTVRNSIADLSSTYKMIVRGESVEGLALTFDWFEADADGVFQPISDQYEITSSSGNTYNYSYIDLNTKGLTPRQYKCVITDPYGHTKSGTWIFTK